MRCFIFIFQTNNRIMIRINTMPLGMQNLLSGNRKLYEQVELCIEHISNGNRRLMIMDEINAAYPVDAPYVISNEDGSLVKYSDNMVKIRFNNELDDTGTASLIDSCNGNETVLKEIPIHFGSEMINTNIEHYDSTVKNSLLLTVDYRNGANYFIVYDENDNRITITNSDYLTNSGKTINLTKLIKDFPQIKKISLSWGSR